jgi:hypothetical protein
MLADAWAWRETHPGGYADQGGDGAAIAPTQRVAVTAG